MNTFVSGFLANTNKMQYPICPTYMSSTYGAMSIGFGDIELGYIFSISLIEGVTTRVQTMTEAMFINNDNGVKTCSRIRDK